MKLYIAYDYDNTNTFDISTPIIIGGNKEEVKSRLQNPNSCIYEYEFTPDTLIVF